MSSNHTDLARKRTSIEALIRQGRALAQRDNVTMESAEAYSAFVDIVIDNPLRPVVDGTQTPDEVIEEAYNRLAENHQDVEQAIESQTDVDNVMDGTVSLSDGDAADVVLELAETRDSLEALRNVARVIYHTPKLRKSRATLESFQRYVGRTLRAMGMPRTSYRKVLKKSASLESIHSVLNKMSIKSNELMDHVSSNVQSVSTESLMQLGDVSKALKIQRVQHVLGEHVEKRGGKS